MKRGDRFTLAGLRYRVVYVSACRAHCVATDKVTRTIKSKDGTTRTFKAKRRATLDISPNAGAATITELLGGKDGGR